MKFVRHIQPFLVALGIAFISYFLFDFLRWEEHDMKSFIEGAKLLFKDPEAMNIQDRISKPIPLILPGIIYFFFQKGIITTILIQNILSQCIFIYYLNKIAHLLATKTLIPLYFLSGPFAVFALFIQSDLIGWTFQIVTFYFMLKWWKEKGLFVLGNLIKISLLFLLGLWVKESIMISILLFFILMIMNAGNIRSRWYKIFISLTALGIVYVGSQMLIQLLFSANVLQRSLTANDTFSSFNFSFNYLKQLFRTIDYFWFIVIIGIYLKWKNQSFDTFTKACLITFICFLVIAPLFKFYNQDRILMLCIPLLIPFYSTTCKSLTNTWILWGIGILNIATTYLIYAYNYSTLIYCIPITWILIYIGFYNPKSKNHVKKTS